MPEWLQALTLLVTVLVAGVGAWATVRAKRIESVASQRVQEANLHHDEAAGIWRDATALREELRRERDELRAQTRAQGERIAELGRRLAEMEAQARAQDERIADLEQRLVASEALQAERECVVVPCQRRKRANGAAGCPVVPA